MRDRPRSDDGWWLYEFQKLATNVAGLVARGQSEAATKLIAETWARWREAPQ